MVSYKNQKNAKAHAVPSKKKKKKKTWAHILLEFIISCQVARKRTVEIIATSNNFTGDPHVAPTRFCGRKCEGCSSKQKKERDMDFFFNLGCVQKWFIYN